MSNRKKNWAIRGAAVILAGACLFGGVALAAGDQNDPLITLSYLTQTAMPQILGQVEKNADNRQNQLTEQFNKTVEEYKAELKQEANTTESATYSVVTLAKGQKLSLGLGCEVMLRVGSASVSSGSSPALINVTTGGSVNNGAKLEQNHLYMATITDRYLTATADTVKVLVRGQYTVS